MQLKMLKSAGVAVPLFDGKNAVMIEREFNNTKVKVQAHEPRFLEGGANLELPDEIGKTLIGLGIAREADPVLD